MLQEALQALSQADTENIRFLNKTVALNYFQNLQGHLSRKRIIHVCCYEHEAAGVGRFRDRIGRLNRRHCHASSQSFGKQQYVGDYIVPLERKHLPGPSKTRLRLVDNEEHAPTTAVILQCSQIAHRQVENTASAKNGFCDERREIAGRLAV